MALPINPADLTAGLVFAIIIGYLLYEMIRGQTRVYENMEDNMKRVLKMCSDMIDAVTRTNHELVKKLDELSREIKNLREALILMIRLNGARRIVENADSHEGERNG